ncbi:MAG: Asp-tRNA(Asn)/Glu-tRNA(Gln) amidotransferase subunit GatB [Clostridiales bacterium]|nr:Asp-tRNA(Asn)/Glu-tRNA(Gln) amidotransferase subunit GatB [Clostridiales bacterium]
MNYEPVIGIEMHAELSTATKVYCNCSTTYGAMVNTQCCPVCAGLPGALPVLNRRAVEYALKMGLACNCRVNALSGHDRKNYFYADLPKGYQISQVSPPLCVDGEVSFYVGERLKRVRIHQIHIEEDTGKLLHDDRFSGTLIDLNRSGVPLIEIVSEPDLYSAEETKAYAEALKAILECLGICNCRMQEGNIRCDVNVSVRPQGSTGLGTRVEMKNISTFSGVTKAIEYEVARQIGILNAGEAVQVETRRWDEALGENFAMRAKGEADYRCFADPDLALIRLEEADIEALRRSLPELPLQKYERYLRVYGLSPYESGVLAGDLSRAAYFERCAALDAALSKPICNWLLGDLSRLCNERGVAVEQLGLAPEHLLELIRLTQDGTLSSTAAKAVLEQLLETGETPAEAVARLGLAQINDEALLAGIATEVLAANAGPVAEYRQGKTNVLGFLVGQCMKRSAGKGNPQLFSRLLKEALDR